MKKGQKKDRDVPGAIDVSEEQGKGQPTGTDKSENDSHTAASGSTDLVDQLRLASAQWSIPDYNASTPKAGDRRSDAEREAELQKRQEEEEERLASKRLDDTMKMAMNLQRAAEDELSFHGSLGSRERVDIGLEHYQ